MKKTKKWIALTMSAMTIMSGCAVQENRSTGELIEKESVRLQTGEDEKYIEQLKVIPNEEGEEQLISLDQDVNGNLHFISMNEQFTYHDYVMDPLAEESPVYEKRGSSSNLVGNRYSYHRFQGGIVVVK